MQLKKLVKKVQSAESTISMILGIVVVVIVGVLLFNYFKGSSLTSKTTTEISEEPTGELSVKEEEMPFSGQLPTSYTIKKGDNLWMISEYFYGSGYNWVDVSRENNISNPDQIEAGQKITIPNVPPKMATVISRMTSGNQTPITQSSYTIQKGDSLWNISVRAYQDGFKWTEIAKANNISNPDLIHVGNTLTIPR